MADIPVTNGKAKLPPLKPTGSTTDGDKPKKKVVKKKKKPVQDGEQPPEGPKPKATPRRKKATSANSTDEAAEATTPKKKKRVVKKKDDQEGDPTSARSGTSQGEDVSGSKASLIKSPKDGTPRKKKVKKKVVKKTADKDGDGEGRDNFFDSTLAADLTEIQDDIITSEEKKDDDDHEYKKQPYSTASVILRSQPTEKFYIETDSGFKGENKSKFVKRKAEEAAEKAIPIEESKNTTIEVAIKTQKILRTILLFCHGMLAGMALWHIVMSYILLEFGSLDFILHYKGLSLPVQSVFYILLVLCTVSACDRFDISNPRRGFLLKALTLQNGTISVVIYFAALVVSLTNGALEDKIHLYDLKPMLWNNTVTMDSDITTWRDLNTARNTLSILGWFIISLAPVADRLTDNLREAEHEDLLGVEAETLKASIA